MASPYIITYQCFYLCDWSLDDCQRIFLLWNGMLQWSDHWYFAGFCFPAQNNHSDGQELCELSMALFVRDLAWVWAMCFWRVQSFLCDQFPQWLHVPFCRYLWFVPKHPQMCADFVARNLAKDSDCSEQDCTLGLETLFSVCQFWWHELWFQMFSNTI